MDRLADGADRLREVLDRMVRRHVAGLEMHFGGAVLVARDEAEQNLGEELALLRPEPAHDPAIDRDQPAFRIDEQVSLMQVGVEEAVAQRLAQERLDQHAPEPHRVVAGAQQRRAVGERDAVDPFES